MKRINILSSPAKAPALIWFLLLTLSAGLWAQSPSVTLQVVITPPLSPYFEDYLQFENKAMVILNGMPQPDRGDYEVYLRGQIEGNNGVLIRTKEFFKPGAPIIVPNGGSVMVTGSELNPYFTLSNLDVSGIDAAELAVSDGLPEGVYTFCMRAYDFYTDEPLSADIPSGCSQALVIQHVDPPQILNPVNEQLLIQSDPQQMVISWSRPAGAPLQTSYHLALAELFEGMDPNEAIQGMLSPPCFETETNQSTYLYGLADPPLEPGHRYVLQVQIRDDEELTIFRNEYYPDESNNAMGYGVSQWQKQLPYLRAVKNAAANKGIEVKFMATLWSPPGGMKYNNVTNGTDPMWNRVSNGLGPYNNFLEPNRHPEKGAKPNMYPAFVQYCAEAVQRYKDDVGVDLYAFSPANEPRYAQPFNSCVWEPAQYRDMIALLGPEFEQRGFTTKIVGAEDIGTTGSEYAGLINSYQPARPHLGIYAFHGYSNGVTPYLPGPVARQMAQICSTMGIQGWMTETSGYAETWDGAMSLAQDMTGLIKFGRANGWVWWQISESPMTEYVLMNNGSPGIRYYLSKQFYRYIRPGAVLMVSASDDQDVLDIAFRDRAARQLVVVLVNGSTSSKTVSLAGAGIPAGLHMYRSTSSDRCVDAGTVQSSSVALAARSVVTLVGDNYDPPVGVAASRCRAPVAAHVGYPGGRAYTIDGRAAKAGRLQASGVHFVPSHAHAGALSREAVVAGTRR